MSKRFGSLAKAALDKMESLLMNERNFFACLQHELSACAADTRLLWKCKFAVFFCACSIWVECIFSMSIRAFCTFTTGATPKCQILSLRF